MSRRPRKLWLLLLPCLLGAAPVRDNAYVNGTVIQPQDVTDNEDAIFTYLQNGVDTLASGAVGTTNIQNGAVTSAKILDGTITSADLAFSLSSQVLPSGAIFFMLTGSCPSWTTDVSATYTGLFLEVSATQGLTGGSTTHTHEAGTFVGPAHTHAISDVTIADGSGWSASRGGAADLSDATKLSATNSLTASSGGAGAITGTSAAGSSLPPFVSAKLCKVN